MDNKLKIQLHEFIYFMALIPYLIVSMLRTTMFSIPAITSDIVMVSLFFAVVSIFVKGQLSLPYLSTIGFFTILGVVIWRQTGQFTVVESAILLAGAYKVDVSKIMKIYLVIVGGLTIIAFLASQVGIIENLRYIRPRSGIVRNSFGIIYPTDFAAHIFFLYTTIIYLYGRYKHVYWLTSLGVFLAWFVYRFSDARLDAATIMVLSILYFLVWHQKVWINQWLGLTSWILMIAYPLISYWLTINYRYGYSFYHAINRLLSGRLALGQTALRTYGVKLFGQNILFIGNGGTLRASRSYNFVDSSYLKILLLYGLVFLACYVLLMVFFILNRSRKKDYLFLAVFAMIGINSMVAHHWQEPVYNIFSILVFANFDKLKTKWMIKKGLSDYDREVIAISPTANPISRQS
ncbi:hypothetical protein [Streptococcus sp. sy004]|uniref:hypothetical protein n=1 Tax=Streptococcus sp. sy004 TaxID=2600149 RepID=UPI0011B546A2|nr:hypothetical protein [Streptococcus sp. sy004]TWT11038.1 hypothetical protein FRX54_04020 [Streptococcus sp. sy004]